MVGLLYTRSYFKGTKKQNSFPQIYSLTLRIRVCSSLRLQTYHHLSNYKIRVGFLNQSKTCSVHDSVGQRWVQEAHVALRNVIWLHGFSLNSCSLKLNFSALSVELTATQSSMETSDCWSKITADLCPFFTHTLLHPSGFSRTRLVWFQVFFSTVSLCFHRKAGWRQFPWRPPSHLALFSRCFYPRVTKR